MKKMLSIIVALVVVISALSACQSADDFVSTTNIKIDSKSMSEWGFEDCEAWGNKLVEVKSTESGRFILNDGDGKGNYVIIGEGTGFWEFYPQANQLIFSSFYFDGPDSEGSGNYNVLDNNTVSLTIYGEGSGAFKIVDRTIENDILIFTIDSGHEEYYIPYDFVDTSGEAELYQEDGKFDYFKAYLK